MRKRPAANIARDAKRAREAEEDATGSLSQQLGHGAGGRQARAAAGRQSLAHAGARAAPLAAGLPSAGRLVAVHARNFLVHKDFHVDLVRRTWGGGMRGARCPPPRTPLPARAARFQRRADLRPRGGRRACSTTT